MFPLCVFYFFLMLELPVAMDQLSWGKSYVWVQLMLEVSLLMLKGAFQSLKIDCCSALRIQDYRNA